MAKLVLKTHLDPSGMRNKGNTCFFNASMQCLISLPKVVKYFLDSAFNPRKQPFSYAMQNFIFNYKNSKVFDPTEFICVLQGKIKLFNGRQQDAYSFLDSLLSLLINEAGTNNKNALRELLDIVTEDTVKCHECGFSSKNEIHSQIQYLYINGSTQGSLDAFVKNLDVVDSTSPWVCTKCNSKASSSISHQIKRASDYLLIFLNRFQSVTEKNCTPIHVDSLISVCGTQYENIGVVCHSGSLSSGHYYAFAKRAEWVEYNDSTVRRADRPVDTSHAYILFYAQK